MVRESAHRRLILAVLLLGVSVLARDTFAHGTSKSYADWIILGSSAEMRINFAPHDFVVALPGLDADNDQKLSRAELDPKLELIAERVIRETKFSTSPARLEPLTPCKPGKPALTPVGDPIEELQVVLSWECPGAIGFLQLETRYLPELDPPHVSVATFTQGPTTAQHVFTAEVPRFELELEPQSITSMLGAGALRGLRSTLSIALVFVLGLATVLAGVRAAIIYLAVFLLGHTIAALAMPSSALGMYLASVAVIAMGVDALLTGRADTTVVLTRRSLWSFIAGFGLSWFGAVGLSTLPMKLAFVLGAAGAPLVVTVIGAVLSKRVASYKSLERALSAAAVAAGTTLLIISLRS